ncbi:MAG: DEAD/DEAH box helicase [Planctomycetes bacterium]|nr:DEAD/DEAH box helicase [Planctomycetota bacterium]
MVAHPNRSPSASTLRARLARLTTKQVEKLLGARGKQLLDAAARSPAAAADVAHWAKGRLVLELPGARVTLCVDESQRGRLRADCSACRSHCVHAATAWNLVLEEKLALGLALPPSPKRPKELLTEAELVDQELAERAERARTERMRFRSADPATPWTDYVVTNRESGGSYRVALRGTARGDSYCSCPDFRKNTLGTCKHILHVLGKARRRFGAAALAQPYERRRISLGIAYAEELRFRLMLPERSGPTLAKLCAHLRLVPVDVEHADALLRLMRKLASLGHEVSVHPDAEERISVLLLRRRLERQAAAIRKDPAAHPLRQTLLKVELLPYQLDGIAFAAAAGRAILADDMGLGKTIQAIGVAELLAREAGIERVLVVCPASVKAQWVSEVERFSTRTARTVAGSSAGRAAQYGGNQFFTVCNYEQVLRDFRAIEGQAFDLVILDEAQRIKNWEAKTSRVIKSLRSPFALALTGTPLENRLDDLHSIVEFIDDRRLGPAFRFFHTHRVVDEDGRVAGFRKLAALRETLAPILLRRTRAQVLRQLPERTTEIVRVQPTRQQLELHDAQMRVVAQIVNKAWISEVDLLRLQKALLLARMAADSSFLVDKQRPGHSSKLERLRELFESLLAEPDRKVVLFSEWTTMLDEIETALTPLLVAAGGAAVRLDGKVPQARRQALVRRFREDPTCRVFLTTNAGATGLNLQAANTVVNVDLPWNPALLEQRIGRAHRMGQRRPVQVFVLVSSGTIEENMLATLSAKHELFMAVLDPDSTIDELELRSGVEELRRRLEVLLGRPEPAPLDASQRLEVAAGVDPRDADRAKVAAAGGRMLAAAFRFLGELFPESRRAASGASPNAASAELRERLRRCVETDDEGRLRLVVTLDDHDALDRLADVLGQILPATAPDKAPARTTPRRHASTSRPRAPARRRPRA